MKHIWVLFAAIALLAGCKTGPNEDQDDQAAAQATEQAAPAPVREVRRRDEASAAAATRQSARPRSDDPAVYLPEFEGTLESEGYGLDMVLDGSSPEAFRQSLEIVAMDSTPEQYQQIERALGYLRYANLAFQDLNTLYTHLDGMTGREVIEYARSEGENR